MNKGRDDQLAEDCPRRYPGPARRRRGGLDPEFRTEKRANRDILTRRQENAAVFAGRK